MSSPEPYEQSNFPSSDFEYSNPLEFAEMDQADDVADAEVILHTLQQPQPKRIRVSLTFH